MFLANPDRYVPALNGNSVLEYVHSGTLAPGNPRIGLFYRDRVYLFRNQQEKEQFNANPAAYADVDLAHRGASAVSLVESNRSVPGNPAIATRYRGLRYLFVSDQQRDAFLSDPDRYAQRSGMAR